MKRIFGVFLFIFFGAFLQVDATASEVLARFKERAAQSNTDALLVLRDGKPVFEYCRGKHFPRLDCHEMARPILALAVGFLWDERYITSLDTPVSTFCASWDGGSSLSIRTLLAQEDDSFFRLGEVVKALSGEEWHDYIQIKLFTPLGIKKECWCVEANGVIKVRLTAPELAKVGQLVARNGELNGKQLLSRHWIQSLYSPVSHVDPFLGLQWYLEYFDFSTHWDQNLLGQYSCHGVSPHLVQLLRDLNGRVVHLGGLAIRGHLVHAWGHDIFSALGGQQGLTAILCEAHSHHLPFGHFNKGGIKSLIAWGKGGQQLIVVPGRNVIAIRQASSATGGDRFEDLVEVLDDYIREVHCYVD